MDITSPFFIVPVMAAIFLSCILFAGLTDVHRFDETPPDDSNPGPSTY